MTDEELKAIEERARAGAQFRVWSNPDGSHQMEPVVPSLADIPRLVEEVRSQRAALELAWRAIVRVRAGEPDAGALREAHAALDKALGAK